MRILMVEDEIELAEAVKNLLEQQQHAVDLAHDGEDGLDLALTDIYDLIILDIMLPKRDGLEILREVRSAGLTVPIILLTARTTVTDKVNGLDAGADDYLPKPFESVELLARIRAIGRRNRQVLDSATLSYGDVAFMEQDLTMHGRDKHFKLTKKEAHLLEMLIKARGNTVPKEMILDRLWGFSDGAVDNNVEVYVSFLRKKMRSLEVKTIIKTIHGIGYRLESQVKDDV